MTERIVAAAIYKGVILSLPPPARHHTILNSLAIAWDKEVLTPEQGFLTSTGRFVNRVEAYDIARREGQIIGEGRYPNLFSEDLW